MARTPMAHDVLMEHFCRAAAAACAFEMSSRMLADAVEELGDYAPQESLEALMKRIVAWMAANDLQTPEVRDVLVRTAMLRNRLVHLELSRTTGRLLQLGVHLERGGVTRLNLATGESTKVADESLVKGRVFGWLLESFNSGAFEAARQHFLRCTMTLEETIALHTQRQIEEGEQT